MTNTATTHFRLVDLISAEETPAPLMHTAGEIMNDEVKSITLDYSIKAAIKFIRAYNIRHAAVIDLPDVGEKKPYFVGVISERDLLRATLPGAGKGKKEQIDPKAVQYLLGTIVTRKPLSASPETTIPEVIATMIDNHIDLVPVVAEEEAVGMVTTTDIIKLFAKVDSAIHDLYPEAGKNKASVESVSLDATEAAFLSSWVSLTVEDIMTREVVCLEPEDKLATAKTAMQKNKFRHVPIVGDDGQLLGIVSDRDILRHLPFSTGRRRSGSKAFRANLFTVDLDADNLKVLLKDIMTQKTSHVSPDCSVLEAAQKLRKRKISCLPVVDEDGKLLGIVTVTDLMRAMAWAYEPTDRFPIARTTA